MYRVISAAVITLTLISSGLALTQNSSSGSVGYGPGTDARLSLGRPGVDEAFLEDEMNIVSAESEWSEIASAKGTNPDVKALANETVTEDTPVAARLVSEAKASRVKVPDGVSGKFKKESEKLNSLRPGLRQGIRQCIDQGAP
jgi:predicted outer membrane protein